MYIAKIGIYGIMKKMKGGGEVRTEDWIKQNAASLAGKRVAISGSTGGLGKALCAHMAVLGVARLILLDRNASKVRIYDDNWSSESGIGAIFQKGKIEDWRW